MSCKDVLQKGWGEIEQVTVKFKYVVEYNISMETITLERIHKDIKDLKREVEKIHTLIEEDCPLKAEIKEDLKRSRKEPLSGYRDHQDVVREFSS